MAMTKAELQELQDIKSELRDIDSGLTKVSATLDGVKILVPIMAATNGLLVIVGLSLVGTLIAKLFGWV